MGDTKPEPAIFLNQAQVEGLGHQPQLQNLYPIACLVYSVFWEQSLP